MDEAELIAEIRRLDRLLKEAHLRATAQYALIDKLTAARLHVQGLLKRLEALHRTGRTKKRTNRRARLGSA